MLRQLPQVQALLEIPAVAELVERYSHSEVVTALRHALDQARTAIRNGDATDAPTFDDAFFLSLEADIERARSPNLKPVINATGIIIHTNLGRAPLAPEAIAAMQAISSGYSNLELDTEDGKRGSRYAHVEGLIKTLTGAEAAIVVNNCAGAVMLSLSCFARDREVIVSRGELVEIGGSFRLPDVIEQSGARLREVGATNKTRASDYEAAINDETSALLKSHTSNFKMVGFTSAPARADLAALARENELILMEDLGSGVLVDLSAFGLPDEPVVRDVLSDGVDLVMFSGDKLLGGPQAGIIAGRRDLIARLKRHPLLRAVRIDKLSLAALEATLRLYQPPHDPMRNVPVLAMLSEPLADIEARAQRVLGQITPHTSATCAVVESTAYAGGGSLPEQDLKSAAVTISSDHQPPDDLAARLRRADHPVLARISEGVMRLDMRAVRASDVEPLCKGLRKALAE